MSVEPEELRELTPGERYLIPNTVDVEGNQISNVDDPAHPLDAVNLRTLNKALANAGLPTLEIENVE